jgi:beta-lactamase superfamily II metal-dependent hydrolase
VNDDAFQLGRLNMPARAQWWSHCIGSDDAPYYDTAANATAGKKGLQGYFIWGDRVRVLEGDPENDTVVRIGGRGAQAWIKSKHLNGEPLLELYVIDVGQGDGLLIVTPEGHHLLIDGGNLRTMQKGGKNAADFIDWKFFKDYRDAAQRDRSDSPILLDAVIASHCDQDHFGGLLDLLDLDAPKNKAELDCSGVQVDNFYHAGLSWWYTEDSRGKASRTLGDTQGGAYVKLLEDRASARDAVARLGEPDEDTLKGAWGQFVRAMTKTRTASNAGSYAKITRLSHASHDYLPKFGPNGDSAVSIRVLGPIELDVDGKAGLKKFPDGDSKNTNGHSVVLRLDYGDRRILLTGDLNTHSQHQLMEAYGDDFAAEFGCDVAKGCHHGSHDVSYRFLDGLKPLGTVISSGDGETHDHPRPTIVSASALTGRKLLSDDGDELIAPLVYVTEVARSTDVARIVAMREFEQVQPKYQREKPTGGDLHNSEGEMSRFRLILEESPKSSFDWPRLDVAKAVKGITYGLVNVRTDGKRLLFAVREETGPNWGIQVLEADQIARAAP